MSHHHYHGCVALLFCACLYGTQASAVTFTVDSLADTGDDDPGDGVCETLIRTGPVTLDLICTLRGAIEEANALTGTDTIEFSVAGTIRPTSALPPVTERLNLNGHSAPGAPPLTSVVPRPPTVVIDGSLYRDASSHGLAIANGGFLSTITNLSIVNVLGDAILLEGTGSKIYGCWIGIEPDGTTGPNSTGIDLRADDLEIGNARDFGSGNVISGNQGFALLGFATSGSVMGGNYIGTDGAGLLAVPNQTAATSPGLGNPAVLLEGNENLIGGRANIIAGNPGVSILVRGDANRIEDNLLGVNANIETLSAEADVVVIDGSLNQIGGPGAGNVIAGGRHGIAIPPLSGGIKAGNQIVANEIYSNSGDGITITTAVQSTVDNNLISNNGGSGIRVDAFGTSRITNNLIAASGSAGLVLRRAQSALVQNNDIGGSGADGLLLEQSNGATVRDNRIGLPTYQGGPFIDPNNGDGIRINGGDTLVAENHDIVLNLVAYNTQSGIGVVNSSGNTLRSNEVFANQALGIDLDADGVTPNDPDDGDDGANQRQNYPDLVLESFVGSTLVVTASIGSSTSFSAYPVDIQIFLADPSSPGQGRSLAAEETINDPLRPPGITTINLLPDVQGGYVVATAIDADGNSSEFSPPLAFGVPDLPDELFSDGFEEVL